MSFNKKSNYGWKMFFAVSLLMHAILFSILFQLEFDATDLVDDKFYIVLNTPDVSPVSSVPARKKDPLDEKGQVVTTETTGREERPQDSKFLSEKNQTFDRQTIAKKVGSFSAAGRGNADDQQKASAAVQKPKGEKNKADDSDVSVASKKLSLSDLGFNKSFTEQELDSMKVANTNKGRANGDPKLDGIAQNNDYVEDVALGEVTNLNTVEFKYYGFYFRIKQKLEQYWGQSLHEKAKILFSSGRSIASGENRITGLVVSMDDGGNIVEVYLKDTSGIRELDDAAIESFKKAGPFPNPPKGMIQNGMVRIEWGFVVKV